MRYEIVLEGCSPTPLASYLKALAILRLVSEQRDPDARGWWQDEHFVLQSSLDEKALHDFFLYEYQPTPILSPWNGRSGFLEGEEGDESTRGGAVVIKAFSQDVMHDRFTPIKEVIRSIQSVTVISNMNNIRGERKKLEKILTGKKNEGAPITDLEKEHLKRLVSDEKTLKKNTLFLLRNEAPDHWLKWFDACQILAQTLDDDTRHTPLLGRGGVDGSMDFGMNYMECLRKLFDLNTGKPTALAAKLISHALYDKTVESLDKIKPGQFNPGGSKFPNSGTGYEGIERDNPWHYVFMLEGALLFSASATKKLERSTQTALSFPFTVDATSVGTGHLIKGDQKKTHTELWLPLWKNQMCLMELNTLFSEGRATLGGRPAKNGLDFCRAISTLAIDRGISSFQRYGFLKRAGAGDKAATLATPLNRINVPKSQKEDFILELDRWLIYLRQFSNEKNTSNRFNVLTQRLENTLFELSRENKNRTVQMQTTLIILGDIHCYASSSQSLREKLPPIPKLSDKWVVEANDNNSEFLLAVSIASLYSANKSHPMPLRAHIAPETQNSSSWSNDGHMLGAWSGTELTQNMTAVLNKRLLRAEQWGLIDKPLSASFGCDLNTLTTFLSGELDDRRINALIPGLSLCNIPGNQVLGWSENKDLMPPAGFGMLKILFSTNAQLRRTKLIGENDSLTASLQVLRLLQAGRTQQALNIAHRQLQIAGFKDAPLPTVTGIDHYRLAASLLIPLSDSALKQIAQTLFLNYNGQEQAS